MIAGVATVWMPVEDMGRALEFYEGKLELEVKKRDGEKWAELSTGDLLIGLNGRESEGAGGQGGAMLTFQPEDGIDAAVSDLESRGVTFAGGVSDHDWGRVATFKDSEGNDLQLYEPPSD